MNRNVGKGVYLFLAAVLAVGLALVAGPAAVAQAATITVCASGCDYTTIEAAVGAASAGDTINVAAGTYPVASAIALNKANLTLAGAGSTSTIAQVSGTGYRFNITANGVTIQGFQIEKTDKTAQNIIGIGASNVSIKNNLIFGKYVFGDPEVSRAFEIAYGSSGLNIEGNTIHSLRQPGYLNGSLASPTTGTIKDNVVYGTRGWVLAGAAPTFTGNTWGTGNTFDIVILTGTDASYYPNIVTVSNANNGAVIEDQRVVPAVLSVVYVDDSAAPAGIGGQLAPYQTITPAVARVVAGGTINVAAGTYDEDVNLGKSLSLLGAGAGSTTIRGVIGGAGSTIQVAASNVTVAGFTITRLGNTVAEWDLALNTVGIAVQGVYPGMVVRDNSITGNRNGIDINSSSGHTIRNNVITDNRTGMILRNQTDNLTVVENEITNNWTVGILFLDASVGTNVPLQTALNCTFSNNTISGNWYGQIVDRQTGGLLPLPGTNLKNFSGNWLGTTTPVVTTANSTEPGYSAQIPVAFGGTAVAPGGQPDILGPASANIDFTPYLNSGTDTGGTYGFQGDFSNLWVTAAGAQTGVTFRIQEGINTVSGSTVNVASGTYVGAVNIPASLTLKGAQYGVAVSGRTAASAGESTIQGLITVGASNVVVDGFTLTNPGQTYALSVGNHTPSYSVIAITHNIVDTVGAVGLAQNVHAIVLTNGPDSVTIAHNRFNNIKAAAKSVSAVGVLDSLSTNPSEGLVIEGNTFTDIASTTKGAYGVILNNKAGMPGAQIKDNAFSGLSGGWTHAIGLEGPTSNAVVSGNVFSGLTAAGADNAALLFEVNPAGGTVTINHNQFNGAGFYGVAIHPNDLPGGSNGYSYTVNADNNWWGTVSGPGPAGSGTGAKVGANVTYNPFCSNVGCTAYVSQNADGSIQVAPGTSAPEIQALIGAVGSGTVIVLPPGVIPVSGGFTITTPGITIKLQNGTVIQASSPCFTVSSDNVTITSDTPGGGVCEPNNGDNGVQTGAPVNNLVIRNIEIRKGSGATGDGIHIGHNVTNLQILDNYIHTLDGDGIEYAAGVVVSGVHEVQGNLFQGNAGYGVNNQSGTPYTVEYNSWGDYAGPTGMNGDGVSTNLDYIPWTHVGLSMVSSGAPVTDKVAVGAQITYTIKMDAQEVYGADFDLAFAKANLTVVSITNIGAFAAPAQGSCKPSTVGEANSSGVISFCGKSDTAVSGAAQDVFRVVFQGLAAGVVPLNLDESTDKFAMAPPSGGSNNIYAGALTDGSVTVYPIFTVTGRLDLQGRANDTGAVLAFAVGQHQGYGGYTFSTSDYWGAISKSGVVEDTYAITISMARYLDVTVTSSKSVAISAVKNALSTLVLLGGDANDNDVIEVGDAALIGGQYGTSGSNGDINADGAVDLLDLVLMGGNYDKMSNTAYANWTP